MSVLLYLTSLSGKLFLSTEERINIGVYLGFLKTRLKNWTHSCDYRSRQSLDLSTEIPILLANPILAMADKPSYSLVSL